MLEELKRRVYKANMMLPKYRLVTFTWGNASEIDSATGLVAIKPSGVPYDELSPEKMVLIDLQGNVVEGEYKPSSDMPTHIVLYKAFPKIGGIVHTHSPYASSWAQAGRSIPCYGTTHADYFYGDIPCTRELGKEEVEEAYEVHTGRVIIETIEKCGYDPMAIPGIVVKNHGPFAWGKSSEEAVHNAVVLEKVAEMDLKTLFLNSESNMSQYILDKHYTRKHGPNAYYGQK